VAYYFLERLLESTLDVYETQTLLTFIMKEAKASVGNVGRETEMLIVDREGFKNESFFGQSEEAKAPHLFHCIQQFWKNTPRS